MSHKSRHHASNGSQNSKAGAITVQHSPNEMASEHRRALFPEKDFRWRAGEITRLEAFCDVVFGFALTLLVISLEVPHSYPALIEGLRGFFPFAICFAQLVMIWRSHYVFSRRYGLEDAYTVFLNMVLLFLVLFYVYPLKFVFTLVFSELTGGEMARTVGMHEASVLMRLYAAGFSSVFLLFTLMYTHAYRLRKRLELDKVEAHKTRISIEQSGIFALAGIISLVVAFRYPAWAGWLYFALGPVVTAHGLIARKRLKI